MLYGISGCNDEWISNVLIIQWDDVAFVHICPLSEVVRLMFSVVSVCLSTDESPCDHCLDLFKLVHLGTLSPAGPDPTPLTIQRPTTYPSSLHHTPLPRDRLERTGLAFN